MGVRTALPFVLLESTRPAVGGAVSLEVLQMVTYPRTPHGIQEPRLILDAMQRDLDCFDRFLTEAENPR